MSYTDPTVVASGTTFAQFQAGGASRPPGDTDRRPGRDRWPRRPPQRRRQPVRLAAARCRPRHITSSITESNGFGETTAGPQGSQLTGRRSRNQPSVHVPVAQDRATRRRNLYLGAVDGSPAAVHAGATGITTTTYTASRAAADEQLRRQPADRQHDRVDVHECHHRRCR